MAPYRPTFRHLMYFLCGVGCALALAFGIRALIPRKPPELDVIYYPTPHDVVAKLLEMADVQPDDVLYDLGTGDGRFAITAAKRIGCRAVGYELDPQFVEIARRNVKQNQVEDLVTIVEQDIFTVDLEPANVITLYLWPELNVRLIPQLEKMKPGSRIVSNMWDMQGVEPDSVVSLLSKPSGRIHTLYLWTTPLKKTR